MPSPSPHPISQSDGSDIVDQGFYSAPGPADYLGSGLPWTTSWSWFGLTGIKRHGDWLVRLALRAVHGSAAPTQEGTGRISSSQITARPNGQEYDALTLTMTGPQGISIAYDVPFRHALPRPANALVWEPRLFQTARGWVWFDTHVNRSIAGVIGLADLVALVECLIGVTTGTDTTSASALKPGAVLAAFPWPQSWTWWQQIGVRRINRHVIRITAISTPGRATANPGTGTATIAKSKPNGTEVVGLELQINGPGQTFSERFLFADYIPRPDHRERWEPRLFDTSRGVTWFDVAALNSMGAGVSLTELVEAIEAYLNIICLAMDPRTDAERVTHYDPSELLVIPDA